jgi:hypothetical protein
MIRRRASSVTSYVQCLVLLVLYCTGMPCSWLWSINTGNFLTSWGIIIFSIMTLLHRVSCFLSISLTTCKIAISLTVHPVVQTVGPLTISVWLQYHITGSAKHHHRKVIPPYIWHLLKFQNLIWDRTEDDVPTERPGILTRLWADRMVNCVLIFYGAEESSVGFLGVQSSFRPTKPPVQWVLENTSARAWSLELTWIWCRRSYTSTTTHTPSLICVQWSKRHLQLLPPRTDTDTSV